MDSDLTSAEPCAARIIRGFFCACGVSVGPSQNARGLIALIFSCQDYYLCNVHCTTFDSYMALPESSDRSRLKLSVSDSARKTALHVILYADIFRIM